jgi:hypothetical protein
VWQAARFHGVQSRGRAYSSDSFTFKASTVVYTKGTKRDRPDAAAEDKVPTAPYRCKRRCVNQAGPNPADALLSTMGHCFIDETAEIIKPQAFSRIPPGLRVA